MPNKKYTQEPSWNYTRVAGSIHDIKRLISDKRHLIGRDTNVLNGIYTGAYGGEAIVVDYDTMPEYYDRLADSALDRALNPDGTVDKSLVLNSVFDVATELMPYSLEAVDAVNKKFNVGDFRKISLSAYVSNNAGVCRHQALLVTAMLEILKNRGVLHGEASIDRSVQWTEQGDPEGHAWVRYTASNGQVYILDVAQEFIGTLEQSQQKAYGWNYVRPGEQVARTEILPRQAGRIATSGLIEGIPEHLR